MPGFGGAVKLTGESEYRKALQRIQQNLREVSAEMNVVTSQFDKNDKSQRALSAQSDVLQKKFSVQAEKLNVLKNQYAAMLEQQRKNEQKHGELVTAYEKERDKLLQLEKTAGDTTEEYQQQKQKVADLAAEVRRSTSAQESNEKAMSKMRVEISNAEADCNKTEKALDGLGNEAEDSGKQAENSKKGWTIMKDVLADLASTALKSVFNGLKQIGGAFVNLGKQAVGEIASFEQLEGGVKKIFGETLADEVLKNADKAYKTAGLSANQYLDTVTSFSATLIAGLGDDTSKAAKYADMAIRNMSDNANTFGTDMSSIQNAYQGFAKQNYTMLDNLKLGYGGTAAEMARLINESGVLGDSVEVTAKTVKDVPFDQVIRAIDRTQKRMGIAGTTAKEAASTIEGATGSMSAAWKNMVRGLADENSDFSVLTQNWLNTLISPDGKGGMIGTMLPRITQVVKGIGTALQTSVPMILDAVIPLIKEHLPQIVGAAQEAVKAAADVLPAIMPIVAEVVPQIVTMLLSTLPDLAASGVELMKAIMQGIIDGIPLLLDMLPDIARVGVEMVVSIVNGITEAIPDLIEMLPGIISTVVDVLIENLPAVIDAGVALLLALVDGLDVALPMLIDMLPEIVTKISVALVENADKLLEGAVQLFFALVTGLLENIPALIEALGEVVETVISNLTEPLNTLFVNFWNTVTTAASNAWASIKEAWRGAISWFRDNITNPIGRVFSASWDALKKGAADAWEGIKSVFKSVADWFGSIFSKAWQKVKDVFSTGGKIFDGIKEGIVTAFKAVVNGIIGGINKVIALPFNAINGLLNKIRSIDILGFEPFALLWKENPLAVPQIPLLARGGVLRRGQVGVLEGTGAEAVVPLEQNTEWIQRVADEMRNAFDGVTNTGNMVEAFKEALSDMKIELDDEVAGRFVRRTVTRIIYN